MSFFVPKDQAQQRYNICKSCEHFTKVTTMCSKCKCIMKLKVTFTDSKCPIDKWK